MARRKSSLILALLVAGCCETRYVYVPVSSCPPPPVIVAPQLKTPQLAKGADTRTTLEAMANDYLLLKGRLDECLIGLDAYKEQPNVSQPEPR